MYLRLSILHVTQLNLIKIVQSEESHDKFNTLYSVCEGFVGFQL